MLLKCGIGVIIVCLILAFALISCTSNLITITDAKTAGGIDDRFMPVQATNVFPTGTKNVYCWFQWRNAKVGTKLVAKWHYITDNIHILDYGFTIPRSEGSGGISLSMPEEKTLPAGLYKVDLTLGKYKLKTLSFRVQ